MTKPIHFTKSELQACRSKFNDWVNSEDARSNYGEAQISDAQTAARLAVDFAEAAMEHLKTGDYGRFASCLKIASEYACEARFVNCGLAEDARRNQSEAA